MPTMPRLALHACTALACAGLIFGSSSSAAGEECAQGYKVCNVGCERSVNAGAATFCKIQCDYRLIACDQQSGGVSVVQSSTRSIVRPTR